MISVCEEETDNCVCENEYCQDTIECNEYMYARDRHSECCAITYQQQLQHPREVYDTNSDDSFGSDYESFKAVSVFFHQKLSI